MFPGKPVIAGIKLQQVGTVSLLRKACLFLSIMGKETGFFAMNKKSTPSLPALEFSQVPDLAALEERVLAYWQEIHAFEESVAQRSADKRYVFYDGPPFATGLPHYGHLLGSTSKDVIPRYWTMKGYRVERVWGWDCHGLPIENMIERKLEIKGGKKGIEALGIDVFNQACRAEVLHLDKEWEKIINRLGRWVDFEHNYKTMNTDFMESVWWGFKQLFDKQLVYEGKKVILYCPRCATPLSNFEIAMDNSYVEVTEQSTIYKYKVVDQPHTYLLAWSTTPWNKLATPALAVNPTLKYSLVEQGSERYILATERLSMLDATKGEVKTLKTFTGKELEQLRFELHFDFFPDHNPDEKRGVIVADDFVTAEEGTGIVTLAIYGEDDYRVMKAHHIQLIEHVDEEGKLKPEVIPWAGQSILTVNEQVDEDLAQRGLIYAHSPHTHSVATCYRCGTRLYYAPLPAWFIDIAQLRGQLIAQNEQVNWYPDYLKHGRFLHGLESAPDWNISRSRYWGTPMPIWEAPTKDGVKRRIIGSLTELKQWAVNPTQVEELTDIHREFLDDIEVWVDDKKTLKGRRVKEVFDCWVESGSMPFAAIHYPFEHRQQFEDNYPAQFVSEYIAQTRAWFYTMHVMSVAIFGKPSFENVLTTGTILAEDGSKMSKSKGNYPDPMTVINANGADSLRLYLMSSTVMKGENLNFNDKEVTDIRRSVFLIWWNVLSFYRLVAGPDPVNSHLPSAHHIMDRWLLAELAQLVEQVTAYFEQYDVVRASRTLMEFVNTLSTWYVRLSRSRLRQDDAEGERARSVFGHTLLILSQLFAPFCPFFAELTYQELTRGKAQASVHWTLLPELTAYASVQDQPLLAEMELVQKVVELGHAARKANQVKLRQPLSSLMVEGMPSLKQTELLELIKQELNVKHIDWKTTTHPEAQVSFDLTLTPELKAEGQARELIRSIQQQRKAAGLQSHQQAQVTLPEWPSAWQAEIERKTNSVLRAGETLNVSAVSS